MKLVSQLHVACVAALLCSLASDPSQAQAGTAAPTRTYYENGKQISAPLRLPPEYPARERQRRIGGTVIVAFGYGTNGKVTSATIKTSSGNKNLDNAALTAVRRWTIEAPVQVDAQAPDKRETTLTLTTKWPNRSLDQPR
jgi:TonB family protein